MEASNNEVEVPVVVTVEEDHESCSYDVVIEGGSSSSDDENSSEEENPCSPPDCNDVGVLPKSTSNGSPKKNQNNKNKTWQNRNGENGRNTNKGPSRNNFNQGGSKPNSGYGKSGNDNQSRNDLNSSKISYNSPDKNKSDHGYTPKKSKGNNNHSPAKGYHSYNQDKIMDADNCTPNKKKGDHNYSPYKSKGDHNYSPDKSKSEYNNYSPGHVSAGNSPAGSDNSDKKNGQGANNEKKKNNNANSGNKKNTSESGEKVKVTILQQLQYFAPWVHKSKENHSPFNTTVMQLHTRWTVWFFFQIAMIVWQNWYWKEGLIMCINQMDAKKATDHYLNICLSYIFTRMTDKKHLMHYRWMHWMFALLAFAYFILKVLTVVLDNGRIKKFLEDVAKSSEKYNKNSMEQTKKVVMSYFQLHAGHHQGLYMKLIFVHLLAYLLDLAVIVFINFTLQGQFIYLVPDAFPFYRDYVGFTDPLSTVFPPFASCTFNKDWGMYGRRTEEYACHLTLMELYEKVFVLVWLWMMFLVVWSSMFVMFLMVGILPPVWPYIQHVVALKHVRRSVCRTWGVADFYVLFCVKRRISAAAFVQITEELGIASYPGSRDVEQGANRHSYYHSWKPCASDITKNATELGNLDPEDFREQVLSGGNDIGNKLYRRQKKYVGPCDIKDGEL